MEPRLDDPSFEPTDEQLVELSRRAFAGVRQAREAADAEIRRRIATAREEAMRRLRERTGR